MGDERMQLPHKLTLNQRQQLSMTGVSEVVSFDGILHTLFYQDLGRNERCQITSSQHPVLLC